MKKKRKEKSDMEKKVRVNEFMKTIIRENQKVKPSQLWSLEQYPHIQL